MRFAFYGRVSTEDQQDPQASKALQLSRARSLVEPAGGEVVAEFFDIGQSRSLPWKRRPEASRLLAALAIRPWLRGGGHRRAAASFLRQPIRADVPGLHALWRRPLGTRGRRRDRSRLRGAR